MGQSSSASGPSAIFPPRSSDGRGPGGSSTRATRGPAMPDCVRTRAEPGAGSGGGWAWRAARRT
eukprot:3458513-Alexandrium_andersonii.AAC.1